MASAMENLRKITLEDLIAKAQSYMPDLDEDIIRQAYEYAENVHEGYLRYGVPYVHHPLQTAYLMLDLQPDIEAVLACLLHDTPNHKENALSDIKKKFGDEVHGLVEDSLKLHSVKVRNYEAQVENLRRMFMAMARDLRVVFIRLSDRLHNMLMLEEREDHERLAMAQETMDIYAPIASRLGIYQLKGKLEDLAFMHLYPDEYQYLQDEVKKYAEKEQEAIDKSTKELQSALRDAGFEVDVTGRVKHIYSIHSKLKRKNTNDLGAIYDIYALRVLVDSDKHEDLYSILGSIHSRWTPLPHRFKDYLAVPKPNGYRSLHTSIVGLIENRNKPVEIQIRTHGMHKEAEYGIAAHWWYKEDVGVPKRVSKNEFERTLNQHKVFNKLNRIVDRDPELRQDVEGLIKDWSLMDDSEILDVEKKLLREGFTADDMAVLKKSRSQGVLTLRHKYFQDQIEWLEGLAQIKAEVGKETGNRNLKLEVFKDRIFVLTPHGDVKDLPRGATPVDFAYMVHTDVGHRCAQAKADGRIVPLDYELKSGQVVEILTKKEPRPNRYWLSFVKTHQAATKIKSWFRTFDREHNLKEGKEILNKYLQRIGKPVLDPKLSVLKNYGGKRMTQRLREDIVESVGDGSLTVGQVLRKLFPEDELVGKTSSKSDEAESKKEKGKNDSKKVLVSGYDDLGVVLSACCKPKYGKPIVGYVTRGKRIHVHSSDCENLEGLEPERMVHVEWKSEKPSLYYQANISLKAKDRKNLLSDITSAISGLDCNIAGIAFDRDEEDNVLGKLSVEVGGYDELEKVLDKLERVFGVYDVKSE